MLYLLFTFTNVMTNLFVNRGGNEMTPPPFGTLTVTARPDEPLIST